MTASEAIKGLGIARYVGVFGLGAFGGWMFAAYCFIAKINGVELTLQKLTTTAVISAAIGVLWGLWMWYFLISRKKAKAAHV
ncbi:MAG: hypothetical protein OJF55_001086 [Rhodanobacteraceae bacterium]|jgi:hypothetical protein|nr:MAG: hypothetical protein OJF55_001086 [Rhodanobacteraceae bacterium]